MKQNPAAFDVESLIARRARARAEARDATSSEREEPRWSAGEPTPDADMLDVVQKYEKVVGESARGEAAPREPELARAADEGPHPDALSLPPYDGLRPDVEPPPLSSTAVAQAFHREDEERPHFELPPPETVPCATAADAAPSTAGVRPPRMRPLWTVAIAGTAAALVIGVAVGYMLANTSPPPTAKIEASEHGGARLRLDYTLTPR